MTIETIIQHALKRAHKNKITFLTGAGISAASGIPTYRGADGIWIKGTKFYKPESFGTFQHFNNHADEVWQYTFFRKKMFADAEPNPSHYDLVALESQLGDRFELITQNIDNLHQRAGSKTVYEIHGNLREMRCASECTKTIYEIPTAISLKDQNEDLTMEEQQLLFCPECGDHTRPNILWFDEYYNERIFKVDTCMSIAKRSSLLIILGSSGATTLPNSLVAQTLRYGGYVIDVNLEDNQFTKAFKDKKQFVSYRGMITDFLNLLKKEIDNYEHL